MRHSIYVKRALAKLQKEHKMNHPQLRAVSGLLVLMGEAAIKEGMVNPPSQDEYHETYAPGK